MPARGGGRLEGEQQGASGGVLNHCAGSIGRIAAAISGYGMSGTRPKSGSPPPRRSTSDTKNRRNRSRDVHASIEQRAESGEEQDVDQIAGEEPQRLNALHFQGHEGAPPPRAATVTRSHAVIFATESVGHEQARAAVPTEHRARRQDRRDEARGDGADDGGRPNTPTSGGVDLAKQQRQGLGRLSAELCSVALHGRRGHAEQQWRYREGHGQERRRGANAPAPRGVRQDRTRWK